MKLVKVKKTIKKITKRNVEDTEQVKEETSTQKPSKKRVCNFCQSSQSPSYTDTATLKRFLSERGKIFPKGYTHLCSKHQRILSRNIKYARHLALLPFTPKV